MPKHPYKCHVWGGISKKGATDLVVFSGIMEKTFFANTISREYAAPFIREAFGPDHRFQQDNDPKHTSGFASDVMKKLGIEWWKTPALSPDLNPIQFVWGVMKRNISRQNRPMNKNELMMAIKQQWALLTPALCQRYIDHLLKVIPVVIARYGKASGF